MKPLGMQLTFEMMITKVETYIGGAPKRRKARISGFFLFKPRPVTRGTQGGRAAPRKFFLPLEKCVGHLLKLLDIVQKI